MSFARTRNRVKVAPEGASLTEQHWRDRQDVNNIVARCLRGDTSDLRNDGLYQDISELPEDLHGLLQVASRRDAIYDALPDAVREKYRTPADFVNACHDPKERENLKALGLVKTPEQEIPIKVEVTNPPSPVQGA